MYNSATVAVISDKRQKRQKRGEIVGMKDGRTPQLLFTESEVMAALRLSRTSVIKLRSEGKLVPVKIGKSIRYTNADISAFVDQLAVERQRRLNGL